MREPTLLEPRPTRTSGGTPLTAAQPKILVIRPRKTGDAVLLTPLVRTLRHAHPAATLIVLAQPPHDQVFANNPHIDAVWRYPADGNPLAYVELALRLRRTRFDVVIDAFGTPATARLTRITQAQRRIGPRLPGRVWAYTDGVPPAPAGTYAAAAQARLLAPLGLALDRLDTEMFPGPEDHDLARRVLDGMGPSGHGPLMAIGPAAGQAYKRWPAEAFARLADALIERHGARILLVHGPGEAATVTRMRAAMRRTPLPDYPHTRTLTQLAALLARCTMLIGNDTGARHVAIAMGVPTVGIFGRARPAVWTPPGDPRHRTAAFDPGCKSRCVYPRCRSLACLTEITPQAVLAEVEVLMAEPRPVAGAAGAGSVGGNGMRMPRSAIPVPIPSRAGQLVPPR